MPPLIGSHAGVFFMLLDSEFVCAYCGEINFTTIDPSAGRHQSYTEDCQTCCRPNVLQIEIDFEADVATIEADLESNA